MFQLPKVTKATCTNVNPRRELHGEELVRAIDMAYCLEGENTLLDLIEPGLREHHYCNKALKAGQEVLPDMVIPLPNLRHPLLPTTIAYAKGQKWRGYRFIRDFGTHDAMVDFTDAVLSSVSYEIMEGGSCKIFWTVQYNGEELQDNEIYGMLSGLAAEGDIHIRLLAPPELLIAKKGYRAGKPDTPTTQVSDPDQQQIDDGTDPDAGEEEEPGADTPEGAFLATGKPAVTH